MKKIIIAIDGYSGTGKSSTAKQLASALNYTHIDSGAMYRAITYYLLKNKLVISDMRSEAILSNINLDIKGRSVFVNNEDVTTYIRSQEVDDFVSSVSTIKEVRKKLVSIQQCKGKKGGIVMEGRDIGSVVFPYAELKIFMIANIEVRAERRRQELAQQGINITLEEVKNNLEERDHHDVSRKESPLVKSDEAVEIDTSEMTLEQQVEKIINLTKEILNEN